MKEVVVSAMIVDHRNRFLFSRRVDNGKYCPPGGKVEVDEMLVDGLAREIEEEVNLEVAPDDMELLGFYDSGEKIIFFYLIFAWTGEVRNNEPKKHGEWLWLPDTPCDSDSVKGVRYFNRVLRSVMWDRIWEVRRGIRSSCR